MLPGKPAAGQKCRQEVEQAKWTSMAFPDF
jgi:hypothetical protein